MIDYCILPFSLSCSVVFVFCPMSVFYTSLSSYSAISFEMRVRPGASYPPGMFLVSNEEETKA